MVLRCLALLTLALLLPATAIAAPQFPATPAPENIPRDSASDLSGLVAVVTASGEGVAAWRDNLSDEVRTARRPLGGPWQRERTLWSDGGDPVTFSNEIKLGADAAGNVTAVWIGGSRLWYAYRPAGGTFGPGIELPTTTPKGSDTALAVAADGRAVAAWVTTTGRVMALHRPPGQAAFDATADLLSVDDAKTRQDLTATITTEGRAVVAWDNATDDDIDFAQRDATDTQFDPEGNAYAVFPVPQKPQLAADGIGGAHLLFWTSETGPDRVDLWGKVLTATAPGWDSAEHITEKTGGLVLGKAALVAAPDGSASALAVLPGGELVSETRPPGGPWPSSLAPVVTTGARLISGVALHRSPDGALTGLYVNEGSSELPHVITRDPGRSWSGARTQDTADEVLEPALAGNASGDVLATWKNNLPGPDLLHAAAGDSGAPPRVTMAGPASLPAGRVGLFSLTAAPDFTGIASTALTFDGQRFPVPSSSYGFTTPGAHLVTGTATDGRGNAGTGSINLDVTPLPPAPGPAPAPRTRTRQPDTTIDRIPRRVRASRLRRFSGRATDPLGLTRVEIALVRLRGGARFTATASARRCDALRSTGRLRRTLVRRGRCAPRAYLQATGTRRWTFRLERRLPRGTYVLVSRARAVDGAVERGFSIRDRNLVRFRVR